MKMKKLAAALCAAALSLTAVSFSAFAADTDGVKIDETNFPDETFRQSVLDDLDIDKNGYLSTDEVAGVTSMQCQGEGITSLKGIEYFTELTLLDCSYNQITELDVSENKKLDTLYCTDCGLADLDLSENTELVYLYCYNNQLKTLDVSKNTALKSLDCGYNQLETIDVSKNTALEGLDCYNNKLTTLDVSKNTALERVTCNDNQLTKLDVSGCGMLHNLYCFNNKLTSLDVSKNTALAYLYCNSNQLTSLDMSGCKELKNLRCYNNKLAELDISGNPNIIKVYTEGEEEDFMSLPEEDLKDVIGKSYLGIPLGENEEEPATHYFVMYWDKATKILTEPKPEEKPVTLTDEKTKVAVTGMLDGLKLNVKPTEAKDAVAAYDITLTDADNKAVQPSGKIEISIPCETKGLYVYHIKDDGTKEYIESKYVDGCYVFTIDHLSVYALMKDKPEEKPVTKPESKPEQKPADDSNKPTGSAAGIAFAGIALAGAALMVSKKRK